MKRRINQGMAAGLVFVSIVLFTLPAWAEISELPSGNPDALPGIFRGAAPEAGIVMIHNRPVVLFFSPLFGRTPEQRAKLAQERINKILAGKDLGKVTIKQIPLGNAVSIGEDIALLITPEDIDPTYGQTRQEVVDSAVKNLTLAIEEAKELHNPLRILKAAGYTLLATIFFAVILWGLGRASRWAGARMEKLGKRWASRINIKGVSLVEHITQVTHFLLRIATWAVGLFAIYSWLVFSLERFPYTRPLGERLGIYLSAAVKELVLGVVMALPRLFTVVIIIVCTRILTRLVKSLFKAAEQDRLKFMLLDPELARPTSRIIIVILWLFGLIMAYPYLPGSGTTAFKGVTIFAGLIASLGSTSIVNQAAGGLVLMYSRAFRSGDFIKVGETEGVVDTLGILSTKIRTPGKQEITIPNAVLVGNTTINYTRLAGGVGVMIHTSITIGYTTPWRKVQSLLLAAAGRTRGLLSEPAPFVRQVGLSDFYVEYQLVATVSKAEIRSETLTALCGNIQDVFNEHGEQIMSPHYVADPPQKQVIPKNNWFDLPETPISKS